MMKKWNTKISWTLFFNILIVLTTMAFMLERVADADTLFHIKIGEWIHQNGTLPQYDMFSAHEGLKYNAYAYGFDYIVYWIHRLFGFTGITITKYVNISIVYFLLYYIIRKISDKNQTISLIITSAGLLSIRQFFAVRPQITSYIMMLIQIYIMLQWNKNKKSKIIFLIPLSFLLLNSLHAGVFPIHLFFVGSFGLEFLLVREDDNLKIKPFWSQPYFMTRYLPAIILSALSITISPLFPDIITWPFKTIGSEYMMKISEWQSPPASSIFLPIIIMLCIAKTVDIKKCPITVIFNDTFMLYMAFSRYRYMPYMMLWLTLTLAYANIPQVDFSNIKNIINKAFPTNILKAIPISILIISWIITVMPLIITPDYTHYLFKSNNSNEVLMLYYETVFPVDAVNYLKENNITDNIYNDYNIGSYLIFNEIKVFVDPRCDLYSQEINNVDILKDELNMPIDDIMEKYNLKYALLGFKNDKIKIAHVIDTPEKYKELYSDDEYAVFEYLPNS